MINLLHFLPPPRGRPSAGRISPQWDFRKDKAFKAITLTGRESSVKNIRDSIFTPGASASVIQSRLDTLASDVSSLNICRYNVKLRAESYSEEHKVLKQLGADVTYSIVCRIKFSAEVTDCLTGKKETFQYPFEAHVPKMRMTLRGNQSTNRGSSYRLQAFQNFGLLLGASLLNDLHQKYRKEQ